MIHPRYIIFMIGTYLLTSDHLDSFHININIPGEQKARQRKWGPSVRGTWASKGPLGLYFQVRTLMVAGTLTRVIYQDPCSVLECFFYLMVNETKYLVLCVCVFALRIALSLKYLVFMHRSNPNYFFLQFTSTFNHFIRYSGSTNKCFIIV